MPKDNLNLVSFWPFSDDSDDSEPIPTHFDWREKGVGTAAKE